MSSILVCSNAVSIFKQIENLAKLGDGLDESPTVMVGDKKTKKTEKLLEKEGHTKTQLGFQTNIKGVLSPSTVHAQHELDCISVGVKAMVNIMHFIF